MFDFGFYKSPKRQVIAKAEIKSPWFQAEILIIVASVIKQPEFETPMVLDDRQKSLEGLKPGNGTVQKVQE